MYIYLQSQIFRAKDYWSTHKKNLLKKYENGIDRANGSRHHEIPDVAKREEEEGKKNKNNLSVSIKNQQQQQCYYRTTYKDTLLSLSNTR